MSRGFANATVGGIGNLIRSWIQSVPFVSGSVGWRISKNGNAEFNNVIIRGGTTAQGVSLYYFGVPAIGNLFLSIAAVAGTDIFGNAYPQGIGLWDATGAQIGIWNTTGFTVQNDPGTGALIAVSQTSGSPLLKFRTGSVGVSTDAAIIYGITNGSGPTAFDVLFIQGSDSVLDSKHSFVSIEMDGAGNGLNAAHGSLQWLNDTSAINLILWDKTGAHCIGSITAIQPGTSAPPVAEVWHPFVVTDPGWTTTGIASKLRYRVEGLGAGVYKLDGAVQTTGAGPWPINTVIGTLPAGPSIGQHQYITPSAVLAGAGGNTANVQTTGAVRNGVAFTAAGQQLFFDGVTFPVD